jgi:hypothetical protein
MKNLTPLILLLVLFQHGLSQSCCINGYICDKKDSSAVIGAYIIMFTVNKSLYTDRNGFFEICDLEPGEYSFGIALIGYKDTTITSLKISLNEIISLKIYLSTCRFDILGKSNICPKCGRDDMVIPILYEVASMKMIKRVKKGTAYLGGHRTGCDPTYFCKRDLTKY